MKREFLMLAQNYDQTKHGIAGWFVSEKLDGIRAFWDGGVSRGVAAALVPWANVEKDARYINRVVATGLWTRYGKSLQAPGDWLDRLPLGVCLDGELYMGRGLFQKTISTVKRLDGGSWYHDPASQGPDSIGKTVQFRVFDAPNPLAVFNDGTINNTNMRKKLVGCYKWWLEHGGWVVNLRDFEASVRWLRENLPESGSLVAHSQTQLPFNTDLARQTLENMLDQVVNGGGEGLILRRPVSSWIPARTWDMLKVKRFHDLEGTVVGYVAGERTALGSKLLGLMGSLTLRLDSGVTLNLSGFTDGEREMAMIHGGPACEYLARGDVAGRSVNTKLCVSRVFPLGSRVSVKYRELTVDGIPKEARYFRKV